MGSGTDKNIAFAGLVSPCCPMGENESNTIQRVSAHPLTIDLFSITFFFTKDSSQPTIAGALENLLGSSK